MSWKGVDEINFVHTRFLFDAKPKYQCNSGGGEKKKLIALNKIQEILLTKSLNKPNKYIKNMEGHYDPNQTTSELAQYCLSYLIRFNKNTANGSFRS